MLQDEVIVDCGKTSRKIMDAWLQELPNAKIKKLKLVNFDHHKTKPTPSFFGFVSKNYILRVINATRNNAHIESLELGNEFVKQFHPRDHFKIMTIGANYLHMSSLKELILENADWEKFYFTSLQEYLTDPKCTLERLELKSGLSAKEISLLEVIFAYTPSLKQYKGPGDVTLQRVLDTKQNNYDIGGLQITL